MCQILTRFHEVSVGECISSKFTLKARPNVHSSAIIAPIKIARGFILVKSADMASDEPEYHAGASFKELIFVIH